ncbi:ROK family transcriptional regulator [Microbispora sp. RL4-1S]|uniref:ROK family transcriptional regulator n=1 Tax=Microbispora oryzae TaxID=2806554 RepID=A0A940WVL7_9ACTN|nr:ROK family transcriptional regulator [Microbispora oryzae]MBP2707709.1 ROK family transcriptional regulator [Microbispora oryzae]
MVKPADLDFLRDYNDASVVAVARRARVFDRATIASATGLTPQAVSKVVARLVAAGLVEPDGVRRQGVGKPASVYRLVPNSRYAIGAHVARRTLRMVLSDLTGQVLNTIVGPLPPDFTPERLLDELAAGVGRLAGECRAGRLVGVGIGMVGPLDHAQGVVRDAHRLRHWHDVPLREMAAERLGLPVMLDKDVAAGVVGEAWLRGPHFRDAALIMVESGIGAGLWLGGSAYRGAHTNAGEFGHMVVQTDGPPCVCGRRGCLETLHDRALARGDVGTAARVLAVGVVNLLQTLDVGHVVLAGADLLPHAAAYLEAVRTAVRTEVPRADWLAAEVTTPALGVDVIAAGAAMGMLNERYGLPTGPRPAEAAKERAEEPAEEPGDPAAARAGG